MRPGLVRLLWILGPALLVAGLAAFSSSWPLRQTLLAKEREQLALRDSLPTAAVLQAAEARRSELRERLRQREAALATPPTPPPTAILVAANERASWHRQIDEVLARHRLVVRSETRHELGLPPAVGSGLAGLGAGSRSAAWTLQLAGSYPDVLAALAELQRAPLPVVVLDLAMRRDADGALVWTLVVV